MTDFTVTILPAGITFSVSPTETVLSAALRHGIAMPYRCQQGVCSSCVCRRQSGTVQYQAPEPEHRDHQFTYCCLAFATSDLVLQHPFIRGDAAN